MQWFRVDLKTFWAWLCLTNAAMLSQGKYLAGLWVGFLGKKSHILYIALLSYYIYLSTAVCKYHTMRNTIIP